MVGADLRLQSRVIARNYVGVWLDLFGECGWIAEFDFLGRRQIVSPELAESLREGVHGIADTDEKVFSRPVCRGMEPHFPYTGLDDGSNLEQL